MTKSGLIIVSKPAIANRCERHWIIRTMHDECELVIEDITIKGIIVAHASTYDDACKIMKNMIEGEK